MADGILEKGILGSYMPEFDLGSLGSLENNYLHSEEWNQIIRKWECQVASVAEAKGSPPQFYRAF